MSTKDIITKDGKVLEALQGGLFKIELDGEEATQDVFGALSGKMRKFRIRIMPGDRVKIDFSPHDLTRGRISYRYR
jgi:translation initiation factor IF-1